MNPTFSPIAGFGGEGGSAGVITRGEIGAAFDSTTFVVTSAEDVIAPASTSTGLARGDVDISIGGDGGSGGAETITTGSGAGGASATARGLAPPNCTSRYSAVILSSELEGTLAPAMPSSLALAMTSLLSIPRFFAMS